MEPIRRIATGKHRGTRVILPEEERPDEPYVVATLRQMVLLRRQGHLYEETSSTGAPAWPRAA